jgi:hypothetical protein
MNDGGPRPRTTPLDAFARRWRTAGSQAVVVRPAATAGEGR